MIPLAYKFPPYWHSPCKMEGCKLNQEGGKKDGENKNWDIDFGGNLHHGGSHSHNGTCRPGWKDEGAVSANSKPDHPAELRPAATPGWILR